MEPDAKYGRMLRSRPVAWISSRTTAGHGCEMLFVHAAALPFMITVRGVGLGGVRVSGSVSVSACTRPRCLPHGHGAGLHGESVSEGQCVCVCLCVCHE